MNIAMTPDIHALIDKALDVTAPPAVEIEFDKKRGVLYVNILGITILRTCRCKDVTFKEIG